MNKRNSLQTWIDKISTPLNANGSSEGQRPDRRKSIFSSFMESKPSGVLIKAGKV